MVLYGMIKIEELLQECGQPLTASEIACELDRLISGVEIDLHRLMQQGRVVQAEFGSYQISKKGNN